MVEGSTEAEEEYNSRCENVSALVVHLQRLLKGYEKFVLVFDGVDKQREAPPTLIPALARLGEFVRPMLPGSAAGLTLTPLAGNRLQISQSFSSSNIQPPASSTRPACLTFTSRPIHEISRYTSYLKQRQISLPIHRLPN